MVHSPVPVSVRAYVRVIIKPAVTRSRGGPAAHDPEPLLHLVAAGANAVSAADNAAAAAQVAMAGFNTVRAQVDAVRGVDPTGPERTPTAEASQMRFSKLAGRLVPWSELVAGALLAGRRRTMWLAALRRTEAREDLTDDIVAHALRFVAARRKQASVSEREYTQTRDKPVAVDRAPSGGDGILDWLLPTGNQVLVYCGGWPASA